MLQHILARKKSKKRSLGDISNRRIRQINHELFERLGVKMLKMRIFYLKKIPNIFYNTVRQYSISTKSLFVLGFWSIHPLENSKKITRHPLGILDDEASIDFIVTSSHVILSKCYLTHAFPRHGFHPPWCITFQVYMIPKRNQHQGHEEKGRIWPNGIIFHQPRFPWNKGISLPQLPEIGSQGPLWGTRCNLTRRMVLKLWNNTSLED